MVAIVGNGLQSVSQGAARSSSRADASRAARASQVASQVVFAKKTTGGLARKKALDAMVTRIGDIAAAIAKVSQSGIRIKTLPPALQCHPDVILEAIKTYPRAFKYALKKDYVDYNFSRGAVWINAEVLNYVNEEFRNDPDFNLDSIRGNPLVIQYVNNNFRYSEKFNLDAIAENAQTLQHVCSMFRKDRGFNIQAISQNGEAIRYVDEDFRLDEGFNLEAVAENPKAMEWVDAALRERREFNLAAIQKNGEVFDHISEEFSQDLPFIFDAIEKNAHVFPYLPEALRKDKRFCWKAFNKNPFIAEHVPKYGASSKKLWDSMVRQCAALRDTFVLNEAQIFENPQHVLLSLLPYLEYGLPKFQYIDSNAVDAGGVSRDFVTKIFKAVCAEDNPPIPLKWDDGRCIFKIGSSDEQIKSVRAVGALFAAALKGHKAAFIGSHFHPVTFKMLQALFDSFSSDEIMQTKENSGFFAALRNFFKKISLVEELPIEKIPVQIFNRLYKTYVQEYYHFTDEQVESLLKKEIPPELEAFGGEDLEKEVHEVIRAAFVLGQSIVSHVKNPWEYDDITEMSNSWETLRKRIEGTLTKEEVLGSLEWPLEENTPWDDNCEATQGYLMQWIEEAPQEMLEKLVVAITGSSALLPSQELNIELYQETENLPVFRTCFWKMRLPSGYLDYETFKAKLEIAIENSQGFQLT